MTAIGTLIRLAVALIVIVAVVSFPLFTVYRSTCETPRAEEKRYTFVPPWDDPPRDCRDHENGFEILGVK